MTTRWTKELVTHLREFSLRGMTNSAIASRFSDMGFVVTIKAVEGAKVRYGLTGLVIDDLDVPRYTSPILPEDNYMVSCDYHAPFHSAKMTNYLLMIAQKFGIKKHALIGDLFDMDWAKKWYSDSSPGFVFEKEKVGPLLDALGYFEMNFLIRGNHENRVGRLTDGKLTAESLYELYGGDSWKKSFRFTTFDKVSMGKWSMFHPKSYSQITTSVAKRLAEKFRANVINTHGHLVGYGYDRSGTYEVIDIGGMFDRDKIEYINMVTTTHPMWKNGFAMIRKGKMTHFREETDWDIYL